ncbi:hypothetical protein PIB30_052743 [Stylosanthes scabra]|uniref:Uncharacterized protein n=1 Tax=Stylosanthes scabra TaxID=79078 RepID=A0ABU6VHU5_9FABA|nr:hypothetical protein [Stylosanthes scabra]
MNGARNNTEISRKQYVNSTGFYERARGTHTEKRSPLPQPVSLPYFGHSPLPAALGRQNKTRHLRGKRESGKRLFFWSRGHGRHLLHDVTKMLRRQVDKNHLPFGASLKSNKVKAPEMASAQMRI